MSGHWSTVGAGTTGFGNQVVDMTAIGDSVLYVGGSFLTMDGKTVNKIASYKSGTWCTLGFGVDLRVEQLTIYNGNLIINGDLFSADGVNSNIVIKYSP